VSVEHDEKIAVLTIVGLNVLEEKGKNMALLGPVRLIRLQTVPDDFLRRGRTVRAADFKKFCPPKNGMIAAQPDELTEKPKLTPVFFSLIAS
jgi:hypothetical protein